MTNFQHFLTRWLVPALGAVAVAGLALYWQWSGHPDTSAGQAPASDPPASATTRLSSADVVALQTASRHGNDVKIELAIKHHWHINANPASLDFLIPTEIEISADGAPVPLRLNYPSGHVLEVGLGQPIEVYSGRAVLSAEMPEPSKSQPLRVDARVQACNDAGRCLAPSTLSARLTDKNP